MRTLLAFGLVLLWPTFSWAADAVDVRIAVVLAKEKWPEGPLPPDTFVKERRHAHRDRDKDRDRDKGEDRGKHKAEDKREKREKPEDVTQKKPSEGEALDAEELRPMQKALGLRRHYAWLQRYSKKRATVDAQGETIELPGGAVATVRLQALTDGVATLVVTLPATQTVYQLGRRGSLYLQAGKHEDKEVWLVISPKKHFH